MFHINISTEKRSILVGYHGHTCLRYGTHSIALLRCSQCLLKAQTSPVTKKLPYLSLTQDFSNLSDHGILFLTKRSLLLIHGTLSTLLETLGLNHETNLSKMLSFKVLFIFNVINLQFLTRFLHCPNPYFFKCVFLVLSLLKIYPLQCFQESSKILLFKIVLTMWGIYVYGWYHINCRTFFSLSLKNVIGFYRDCIKSVDHFG